MKSDVQPNVAPAFIYVGARFGFAVQGVLPDARGDDHKASLQPPSQPTLTRGILVAATQIHIRIAYKDRASNVKFEADCH